MLFSTDLKKESEIMKLKDIELIEKDLTPPKTLDRYLIRVIMKILNESWRRRFTKGYNKRN